MKHRGITLAELLLVVVLMSIIIFGVYGVNYFGQLYKANDLRRKENLIKLQKIFEDFHNDHNRYPNISEVAYELGDEYNDWQTANVGKICGNRQTTQVMNNYFGELPCDPQSPERDYVYFVFNNNQQYAIFANLENESDSQITELGCQYGCSYYNDENDPTGSISTNYFNYYVASSDFKIEFCYGKPDLSACYPNALHWADRCQPCPDGECVSGYATIYCTSQWCSQMCQN